MSRTTVRQCYYVLSRWRGKPAGEVPPPGRKDILAGHLFLFDCHAIVKFSSINSLTNTHIHNALVQAAGSQAPGLGRLPRYVLWALEERSPVELLKLKVAAQLTPDQSTCVMAR